MASKRARDCGVNAVSAGTGPVTSSPCCLACATAGAIMFSSSAFPKSPCSPAVRIQPADEEPRNRATDGMQSVIRELKDGGYSLGGQVLGHLDITDMCGHKTACDVGCILHHAGFRLRKMFRE